MDTLYDRFAYARKMRGYTQSELAKAAYVTRGVVTNIEANRKMPQMPYLVLFAQILNVNLDWLLDGTGPMEPDNERSKILNELYRDCATLTEPQQKYILETIRLMREHLIEE